MRPSPRQPLSPAPLVLALALAAAALVFSRGPGEAARRSTSNATSSPSPTATAGSPSPTPQLPACSSGDALSPEPEYSQWRTTLLDTYYRLPAGYVPPDLAPIAPTGLTGAFQVRSLVLPDLEALASAAKSAGHPLGVVAAYRSTKQQSDLLKLRIKELGAAAAARRVARPGHSEHQLGTAIDFTSQGLPDVSPAWGGSPTGRWMGEHSWEYGFVLSYPAHKLAVTCYRSEPWHFRYVGRRLAAKVHESGLTLREYLWSLAPQPTPAS